MSAVFSAFHGFCAKFVSKSKIPLAFQTVLIYNIEAVRSRCADPPCRLYGKRLWLASAFRLSLDAAKIEAQPLETTEYATVAQLVEQLIRNQQVGGSSPPSSSKNLHTGFVPCESGIGRCRRWRRPENGAVPFSCFPQSPWFNRRKWAHYGAQTACISPIRKVKFRFAGTPIDNAPKAEYNMDIID